MTSRAAARAGWTLHGVRMGLESDSEEATAYIRAHLRSTGRFPEDPHLRVAVRWRWGGRMPPQPGAPPGAGAQRVGKDLFEMDGRLHWARVPGFDHLWMEAGQDGATLGITADCRYVPRDPLARVRYLRASRRSKKTHRVLFKLMYYVAYYPMIWYLERTRGWGLLHASAVERAGRAILFSGLGGVGKSTLALSLMGDPAFRFVSDNLLLHDNERIYALPEPVRLDASAAGAVRAAGFEPSRSEVPLTAHPKPTYWPEASRIAESAAADAVIVLRFAPRALIRPLSASETLAHLTASRDLAKEVDGCRSVSAFLSMAASDDGDAPPQPASLASLVAGARGYLLGIGEGEPVSTTLARIREVCS